MPGFKLFQFNLYYRDNELGEENYQATVVWGLPLGPLYYDGFLDWASARDNRASSLNLTSQLNWFSRKSKSKPFFWAQQHVIFCAQLTCSIGEPSDTTKQL